MTTKLHLKMMIGDELRTATVEKDPESETDGYKNFTVCVDRDGEFEFDVFVSFDYNNDIVFLECSGKYDDENEDEYGDEVKGIACSALKAFKSFEEPDIAYVLNDFRAFEEPEEPEPEYFGELMEIPEDY